MTTVAQPSRIERRREGRKLCRAKPVGCCVVLWSVEWVLWDDLNRGQGGGLTSAFLSMGARLGERRSWRRWVLGASSLST